MHRINLGSGQRPFAKPFINIDINPRWNPDVVADGASMPMFENASAEIVVCHHTLEHYGCGEAKQMIKECHRILAPGGSLLVFVPDMMALAQMWISGKLSTQVYMTNTYGAFMQDEADRHKWGYDRKSLIEFLRACAEWRVVVPFGWRDIPGASIARDTWILGIEAIK